MTRTSTTPDVDMAFDYLVESGIASSQTLQVAVMLEGYTLETLDAVSYILTGLTIDQLKEEE